MSELPKGWGFSSLLDIVNLHDSRRIPLNQKQRAERQGEYPYYGANGQVDSIDDFIFDGNYILLAEDGGYFDNPSKGVAYEVSGQFWVNNHAHILSPCGEIPIRFLSYVLNSLDWMPYVGGSTRLKLTQESMRRVLIPLPPLNEQGRIVAKLDRLFAHSRCAREELGRVSGLVQRYKQAVLAAAFRGDLTADWREENTDVETAPELLKRIQAKRQDLPNQKRKSIGGGRSVSDSFETPATWLGLTLGDVIDYGKTVKSEPDEIPHDAWVLELEDIEKDKSKLLQRMTFAQRLSKSTKNRFVAGDVLYGKLRPYLNKVLIADQDGYCTTEIIPIKANIGVHECYLFYWLKHPEFLNYVESVSHGIQMPRLGTEAGLQAPFILAPIQEQKEIVRRVEKLFKAIDFIEQEHQQASKLLDRLEQATLSKAFRGELVPQDPNDEPAAVLLERIQSDRQGQPKGKAIKSKQSHR